eukprot:m.546390 g.546390  ORF g.546390 m.546390 type:complete len:309 (+) comp22154_c0_seq2:325-1251(+)
MQLLDWIKSFGSKQLRTSVGNGYNSHMLSLRRYVLSNQSWNKNFSVHSLIEQYRRSNPNASVTEILQTEISLRSEFQRHPIVLRKENAKKEFDDSLQQVKDTIHEFQGALMVVNEVESTWSKARNTLTAYVTISSIGFALLSFVIHSRRTASVAEMVSESMMHKFLALERRAEAVELADTPATGTNKADKSISTEDAANATSTIVDGATTAHSQVNSVGSGATSSANIADQANSADEVAADDSCCHLDSANIVGEPSESGNTAVPVDVDSVDDESSSVGLLSGTKPGFPAVDFVAVFVYIALAAFINQ